MEPTDPDISIYVERRVTVDGYKTWYRAVANANGIEVESKNNPSRAVRKLGRKIRRLERHERRYHA